MLAFLAAVGLMIEITAATDPLHAENQPDQLFRLK